MGLEIERKFLVSQDDFNSLICDTKIYIRQSYIFKTDDKSVRVRSSYTKDGNGVGHITIKSGKGLTKYEWETPMSVNDTDELICKMGNGVIEKERYIIYTDKGYKWEIDYFTGLNEGLIVAEVELKTEDQHIDIPEWCGKEVTYENKYINAILIDRPYNKWTENEK